VISHHNPHLTFPNPTSSHPHHPPGYLPPGYAPPSEQSNLDISRILNLSPTQRNILITIGVFFLLVNVTFFRISSILTREKPKRRKQEAAHLLIVLGSGGHTAEMLAILKTINLNDYAKRTYVVSSGDHFSASKAADFEQDRPGYNIVTVRRARRVHQSFLTTPYTSLLCLWDCLSLLKSPPDLILTNGPGTGVIVILAAMIRLFFGADPAKMRTIFIESWARVKSLSLSGRILKPFVDRFIVQWPELVKVEGNRVEYIGHLMN
jgi:beta-1,4-N-acetylglucosaminyltransferase